MIGKPVALIQVPNQRLFSAKAAARYLAKGGDGLIGKPVALIQVPNQRLFSAGAAVVQ